MDYMDIDSVEEVPDTPERLMPSRNKDGFGTGNRSGGSSSCRVIDRDIFNERVRNEAREKGKGVGFNGSRRLFVRPDNGSNEHDHVHRDKGKSLCNGTDRRSSSNKSDSFVDLTEPKPRERIFGVSNAARLVPKPDRGKGVVVGGEEKGESSPFSFDITPPKVFKHKRLVRNGCISPNNIAKSKPVAENHDSRRVAKELPVDVGSMASEGASSAVDIKDVIAEAKDARRLKGKGVSHHPSVLEEDARSRHMPRRSSVSFKEPTYTSKDLEGWVNTHTTTRKVDPPLVDDEQHISRGKAVSSSTVDQRNNGTVKMDHRNGSNSSTIYNHLEDLDIDPAQRVSAPPETMSRRAHNLGQFKERAQLTKRQRDGVALSNNREFALPRSSDSERPFHSLYGEPSTSRPTSNKNRRGASTSDPVIAIDELSPELGNGMSSRDHISNEDSSVRALQLEADEALARELQEQLYNEELATSFGNDELDSHHAYATTMQQEQPIRRSASRPASRGARGQSASNSNQQSRASVSRNTSANRGARAQSPAPSRLARMRGRFPGQPRTVSSRTTSRNSIFPASMGVEMRMQILEALEAFNDMDYTNDLPVFNDMDIPNDLLHTGRDFNENDYEMLLALDENNHRHGGATRTQINSLPHSTVQTENSQECAVCLETPSIGETIRHLPCLHRFHKDCIDEWLRRKTSCPVCKFSVI